MCGELMKYLFKHKSLKVSVHTKSGKAVYLFNGYLYNLLVPELLDRIILLGYNYWITCPVRRLPMYNQGQGMAPVI